MRCCLPKLGVLFVLLGIARAAVAGPPPPLSVVWQAPDGCPDPAVVEGEITAALAHLHARGAVDMVGEVAHRDAEAGFWLRVKVTHAGQVSERVLALDDCRDSARASALLVALSVENLPPPAKVAEEREPQRRAEAAAPLRLSVGLGPRLALGIAPKLSAGFGFSVAYSRSFWRLAARGATFAESHHTLAGSQRGGSFQLMTAGAFACAGYPSQLALYGCLGARFDHLEGTGTGTNRNASASTSIGSLAAGITFEWSLTRRFSLRSELEAGYTLGDARFVITNQAEPVHEVGGLRGEAGLELAFVF